MRSDKCGVYEIRCIANGEIYVGSSIRIYNRWYQHRLNLRQGKSHSPYLQNAWNKHGEEAFRFSVLEECAADHLETLEQAYIDRLHPKFNVITDVKRRFSVEVAARRAASLRVRASLITHCPYGHEYTEANTYRNSKSKRICRACNAERVAAIYASETPEQREARRARVKEYNERSREARIVRQRAYTAAHKAEKRAYDVANQERANQLRRERNRRKAVASELAV